MAKKRRTANFGLAPLQHAKQVRKHLQGLTDLAARAVEAAEAGHCRRAFEQCLRVKGDLAAAVAHFQSTGKKGRFSGVFLAPTRALRKALDSVGRYCLLDPGDKGMIRNVERRQPGDPIRKRN